MLYIVWVRFWGWRNYELKVNSDTRFEFKYCVCSKNISYLLPQKTPLPVLSPESTKDGFVCKTDLVIFTRATFAWKDAVIFLFKSVCFTYSQWTQLRCFKSEFQRYKHITICLLYVFFWVTLWRLNFICRRFGTLCLFNLYRQIGK
jgi:hypothetical protein